MAARFALIALDETSGTTASVLGSEAHPVLVANTDDPAQWQDGWWAGNGLDRCLSFTFAEDPQSGVFVARNGVCLYSMLIEIATIPGADETILNIGYEDDQGDFRGLRIGVTSAGHVNFELHDDDSPQSSVTSIDTKNALPLATSVGICCFVDNRADGAKTASVYQFVPKTVLVEIGSIQELSKLGPVSAAPMNARQRLTVGCHHNTADEARRWFSGRVRNISVINFAATPVPNVHELMGALAKAEMAMSDEVLRIAGIPSGSVAVQFVRVSS